jgi:aromatic-amino-acid transaminase
MFARKLKKGKTFIEPIFISAHEARDRAAEIGADKVINGTVGALTHNGSLVTFDSLDSLIPRLDIRKISSYSPLQGFPEFIDAVRQLCFGIFAPEAKIAGVAVAGGLGGIHQAVVNYTEIGDVIVTPDWHWGPYDGIVEDNHRGMTTFPFFNNRQFNLEGFKECMENIPGTQETVFILFNSPANNPTGFALSPGEWDDMFTYLNGLDRKIVLFLDSAYLDFAAVEDKEMFRKLDHLRSHILTIVDYSISKSFAKYGMRTAGLMAVHRDEKVLEEFFNIISISNRANYGSVNSMGQLLAMELVSDKNALEDFYKEFNVWKGVLRKRADTFLKYIDPQIITPYKNGFFVSILSDNPAEDVEKLKKENIFLVPLGKGIRVAFCSIEEDRMETLANTINRVIGDG